MRKDTNWIKSIATIIISFTISLFIAEALLRFFEIGYGNNPLERSRIYHHVHPSNYEFLLHTTHGEYGGHNVYYDETRNRVPNRKITTRSHQNITDSIVFLGDSFTEANQVLYEDSFVNLVGIELGVPVTNLGVSSYSPIIYRLQVMNIVNKYKSNTIIMQIYRNDFNDDIGYFDYGKIKDGKVVAIDGGKNNLLISLLRKSYLARFIRKSQLLISMLLESSTKTTTTYGYEQNVSEEKLANTINIISEINDILTDQGKRLYVFLIPSKSITKTGTCCDEDKLYLRFYKSLNEEGVSTINVRDDFASSKMQENLFFNIDIHLTTVGHAILAKSIINFFKNQ